MSESVKTILSKNGYGHVPVYRAAQAKIGCSLAESAERDGYRAWLQHESQGQNALHVIYINTSLETKAVSSSIVPTITCTSSNVLATLLSASAQMPDCKILYGPDTYMGQNLETLLDVILSTPSQWDNARIAQDLHPQHNRESIQRLRDSISVYPNGNCVVHHMFGDSVVDAVKRNYQDAFVTAHLEVPGEMFQIAMQKSLTDDGVVGSTSDILRFISAKVESAAKQGSSERLQFILGTEAGMVTSIVSSVQSIIKKTGNKKIKAEIIFPVSSEAVMTTDEGEVMALVPGVAGGEGCSTAGGCATCPFMKMNHLDAVMDVLQMIENDETTKLKGYLPPDRLSGKMINGHDAVDLGTEAIVYMREFMQNKRLPDELVSKVMRTN
jgi:quinolinate synthase